MEALALENNLIKQRRPKYNILLRDDKNYPYLQLTTSEAFPRILVARHVEKGDDYYAGPFLPAKLARRTMSLAHRLFGLRSCNEVITGQRGRPCLEYDIKRCIAPCVAEICGQERYGVAVASTKLLLEGRNDELLETLRGRMTEAADAQRYEEAAQLRDALRTVQVLRDRQQKVATPELGDRDVFGLKVGPSGGAHPGVFDAGRPGRRAGGAGNRAWRHRSPRCGRSSGGAAAVLRGADSASRDSPAAGHRGRRCDRSVADGACRATGSYHRASTRRQTRPGRAGHAKRRAVVPGHGSTRSPRRISMPSRRFAPLSGFPLSRGGSNVSTSRRSRAVRRWRRWLSARTAG